MSESNERKDRGVFKNHSSNEKAQRLQKLREENNQLRSILISTLHEVRQFSAIITDRAHNLYQEDGLSARAKEYSDNILQASIMLAARLSYADLEVNPSVVSSQVRYSGGVYRKFDKSKHLLRQLAGEKKIKVELHGVSHMTTQMLSLFDMLPFVLLQNAIKYSPANYSVDVYFDQIDQDTLEVCVSSYGPPVCEEELPRLTEREFRSKSAEGYEGQGLGLHLAKRVCTLHNTSISFETGDLLSHSIGGKSFQRFLVRLMIDRISFY